MYPLVAAGAGLASRIALIARNSAPMIGAATARIRALGVTIGSSADDLIAWAKLNPGNAAVAALTLGSLGATVSDLFETKEGQDAATKVALGSVGLADMAKIINAGAASEKMPLSIAENAADVYTAQAILRYARSHYGSSAAAVRAHQLHQAFFEMSLDDVQVGFDTIRL